jgi:phosphoribosylformimino-5-aminoimidazole carboxamide ribotide isomerase
MERAGGAGGAPGGSPGAATRATLMFAPPMSHPTTPRASHIGRVRVIGVIDLRAGLAVHARGGKRDMYQPVRSRLVSPAQAGDASALARAYRDRAQVAEIYVADLDAIGDATGQPQDLDGILSAGLPVMVDAGTATVPAAQRVLALGATRVVVGLETLATFGDLGAIIGSAGPPAVVFSLDLRDGRPVTPAGAPFGGDTPMILAERAVSAGAQSILVLDLGRVGRASGPDLTLFARIRDTLPGIELLAGGGVRDAADVAELAAAGVDGVLAGTALHEGRDLAQGG